MNTVLDKKSPLLVSSLGLWLFVAPISFGYGSFMRMNDLICGFLLVVLGFISMKTDKKALPISCAAIGFWLQLAPLFFWAPEVVSYLNDTLVGMVLMLLVFSWPSLSDQDSKDEVPPGWSFNPSDWKVRKITVFLALVAWFLARYLASYQLGYIQTIHDPFFGQGSIQVISSSLAKGFPVSDAGLGAFGYSLEFLLGLIGSSRRWKTMPWVTALFGMMVIPAGMISIILIISQPVLVGAWCGICLLIAFCMLVMILLTVPEMFATLQLLKRAKKKGRAWQVFWQGDLSSSLLQQKPICRNKTSEFGFTLPWNLLLLTCLGIWLICSPSVFHSLRPASDSNFIAGPLVVAFSIISCSEVVRNLRWVNAFIAGGLVFSTFFLKGFSEMGLVNQWLTSILIFVLAFPKGNRCERYGK